MAGNDGGKISRVERRGKEQMMGVMGVIQEEKVRDSEVKALNGGRDNGRGRHEY